MYKLSPYLCNMTLDKLSVWKKWYLKLEMVHFCCIKYKSPRGLPIQGI